MSIIKRKAGSEDIVKSVLEFDEIPTEGSHNLVESGSVAKAIGNLGQPLQWKGPAAVAELNAGITGIQPGWTYTLTDAGTLTDGSVTVDVGDEVAWTEDDEWFQVGPSLVELKADVVQAKSDISDIQDVVPEEASDTNKLVTQADLENAQDSWQSGFTPKGEADVATINALTTQNNGDQYILTDSGTLTDGSLAVSAGETVAWNATDSVWYKVNQYAIENQVSVKVAESVDFSIELLDKTKISQNVYINSSGNEVSFSGGFASDYILVKSGQTYAIRYSFGGTAARTAFYDINKIFISSNPASDSSVTAPANAKYMRASFITTNLSKASISLGSQPLPEISIPYGSTQFEIVNSLLTPAPYVPTYLLEYNTGINFVDGIFEQSSSSSYKTSDYVNIITTGNAPSEFFVVLKQLFAPSFDLIRFYDKDKNEIAKIKGGTQADIGIKINYTYKVIAPKNAVYIKFAQGASDITSNLCGLAKIAFGASLDYARLSRFSENGNILWIGTSIPQGAEYPVKASTACGYSCINKSLGSSQLIFTGVHPQTVQAWSGRCLTATVAELESLYRQDVTDGVITEATLNQWKDYSYENSIIPYIDGTDNTQVSAIVLDHGFNDRTNIHSLMANPSAIDWSSTDRSNFVGAFNYLYKKILEAKPFVKIIISGYFQNIYDDYYSKDICDMQELVAEKYDLQLMPAWKFSGINFEYVPDSSDYISDFNSTYGTSYTKMDPDTDGNIPLFQFFCPDKVHPHSDETGNCDKRLNAVYTKLLKDSL